MRALDPWPELTLPKWKSAEYGYTRAIPVRVVCREAVTRRAVLLWVVLPDDGSETDGKPERMWIPIAALAGWTLNDLPEPTIGAARAMEQDHPPWPTDCVALPPTAQRREKE